MKTEPHADDRLTAKNEQRLKAVERQLRAKRRRGHLYLTAEGPVIATTTTVDEDPGTERRTVTGPRPLAEAIGETAEGQDGAENWIAGLGNGRQTMADVPPAIVWNTPHLVVTGVTPMHGLLTALHHPAEYPEVSLRNLLDRAGSPPIDELEDAFRNATGTEMPDEARDWLRTAPADGRDAARPTSPRPTSTKAETTADTHPAKTPFTACADEVQRGLPTRELIRLIMRGIPRTLVRLAPDQQADALNRPPEPTGTKWDALLAAVAEHVAWLHGLRKPAWIDEPARFNKLPETYTRILKADGFCAAPGAFIRHGALTGPQDLDARGGERVQWIDRRDVRTRRADHPGAA